MYFIQILNNISFSKKKLNFYDNVKKNKELHIILCLKVVLRNFYIKFHLTLSPSKVTLLNLLFYLRI